MRKHSQELEVHEVDIYENLPKIKPGQVLISPSDNILLENSILPLNNSKYWPDWWKNLDSKEGGLRRCAGVGDYISQGFTVRMWADTKFRPNRDGTFWESRYETTTENNFMIQGFSYDQTGDCPVTKVRKLKNANYIKMINPWLFKTAPGWSCLFLPISWEPNENYTLLPSMVNTDYYHHANVVLNIIGDKEFYIPEGTPLQHVIPVPRDVGLEILWGSEKTYKVLDNRGFGKVFSPMNMKGKYKREQRSIDSTTSSEVPRHNLLCRFFRWIFRK